MDTNSSSELSFENSEDSNAQRLRSALQLLERACDERARLTSRRAYLSLSLDPGMDEALCRLDAARRFARAALRATAAPGPSPGASHAEVRNDLQLAGLTGLEHAALDVKAWLLNRPRELAASLPAHLVAEPDGR